MITLPPVAVQDASTQPPLHLTDSEVTEPQQVALAAGQPVACLTGMATKTRTREVSEEREEPEESLLAVTVFV